jgi:hypothetical protein
MVAVAELKLPALTESDKLPDVIPVQVTTPDPEVYPQDPPEIATQALGIAALLNELKTVTVNVEAVGRRYRWTVSEPPLSIITFPYAES